MELFVNLLSLYFFKRVFRLGTASKTSDIDINVRIAGQGTGQLSLKNDASLSTSEISQNLNSPFDFVHHALFKGINSRVLLIKAKTPVIRFRFYNRQIDVTVNNDLAVQKTDLQKNILARNPGSERLLLLVLAWLKSHQLLASGNKMMRLNSYGATWLVLEYVQTHGPFGIAYQKILPELFVSFCSAISTRLKRSNDDKVPMQIRPENNFSHSITGFGLIDPLEPHNITGNMNEKFIDLLIREFLRIKTLSKMTKWQKRPNSSASDWGLLLLQDKSILLSPPTSKAPSVAESMSSCSDKFTFRISLDKSVGSVEQSRLVQILRELLAVEIHKFTSFEENSENCQKYSTNDSMDVDQDGDYKA